MSDFEQFTPDLTLKEIKKICKSVIDSDGFCEDCPLKNDCQSTFKTFPYRWFESKNT